MIRHNVIFLCKPYYLHCKPLYETLSLVSCKQVQIVVVGEFFILNNNPPKWIFVLHFHSTYVQCKSTVQSALCNWSRPSVYLSAWLFAMPPTLWVEPFKICLPIWGYYDLVVRCHFISLLLLLDIIFPGYMWLRLVEWLPNSKLV